MPARPISVTVIAWILIVFGIFGAFGFLFMALLWDTPLMQQSLARIHAPLALQVSVVLFGVVIQVCCGVAFLFRQNWARFLYTGWAVIGLAYSVTTSPYTLWLLLPSLVFTLVIVYFLFTPAATEYFNRETAAADAG